MSEKAETIVFDTRDKVDKLAADLDASKSAQEASIEILRPIYMLAEKLSSPTFHWVAFTMMSAGVVGFALQLVLAKLVVLGKGGFSFREVLSDLLGLIISLLGLVLTTQAATENSNFTESPTAVLSATALGAIIGLTLYRWGQAQEIQAVEGRKKKASLDSK